MFNVKRLAKYLATGVMPEMTALDESLAEHDKKYHPDGYKEGDSCNKRETMAGGDGVDKVEVKGQRSEVKQRNGSSSDRGNGVTAEEDAAYLDAVKRGDMETARRMVREAAARAMPDTKVVDEAGLPNVVWHGTKNGSIKSEKRRKVLDDAYERLRKKDVDSVNDELKILHIPRCCKNTDQVADLFDTVYGTGINGLILSPDILTALTNSGRDTGNLVALANKVLNVGKKSKYGISCDSVHKYKEIKIGSYTHDDYLIEHKELLTPKERHYLSDPEFSVFDLTLLSSNTEVGNAKLGFFFSPDIEIAGRYTKDIEVPEIAGRRIGKDIIREGIRPSIRGFFLNSLKLLDLSHLTDDDFNLLGKRLGYASLAEMKKNLRSTFDQKQLQKNLQKNLIVACGYDGIKNRLNQYMGNGKTKSGTEICVLSPSQIKSADPVTYDDDGQPIPLSRRFDFTSDDIRY